MNNNTKIRLHLSKNLFESIAKEVLAEAKRANDGYTVAVKQPKMPKQSKSQAASPEVQKTDAEATMGEMETKVDELFGLGGPKAKYKVGQQVKVKGAKGDTEGAETLMYITKVLRTDKDKGSVYQGAEGRGALNQAKYEFHDDQVISETEKMETKVAETAPVKEDMSAAQMLVATLGTVLGVGGTIAASVLKDLKNAKTPEEKKQVLQSLANQMTKAKGIDEVKEEE